MTYATAKTDDKRSPETSFYFTEATLPFERGGVEIRTLVDRVFYEEKSDYAHIQVFDTPYFGRMLVIDGIIQTTVNDEFIYHEMMVYAPVLRFGKPERMLVIGGGDGGSIRHALRIGSLKEIVMVEIDTKIIELSRRFLPELSGGAFDDPRIQLILDDGANYVRECVKNGKMFDIIVLDLTDPVPGSPAEALFTADFYREVKQALSPNGVVTAHGGALLFQPDEAGIIKGRLAESFAHVSLHAATVPAYQMSPFAFLHASDAPLPSPEEVAERFSDITAETKYLTPETYFSTAVLPPYMQQQVESS